MKKICFVVQRYGLEVNGGAELLCREVAEHLLSSFSVTVITTMAMDYMTWKNEYVERYEIIHGVQVYRFPTIHQRKKHIAGFLAKHFDRAVRSHSYMEKLWLKVQGPDCPEMIDWLRCHKEKYDLFIFYTYLYYPFVAGVPEVINKAVLVPTAHDESFIHMDCMKSVFQKAKGIIYLSDAERRFVNNLFQNKNVPSITGGCGIEVPADPDRHYIEDKYGTPHYLIYVGRADVGKQWDVLARYFYRYVCTHDTDLQLYFIGKNFKPFLDCDAIHFLGYVSDEVKNNCVAGAEALILPSPYESLSMVVLEAMGMGVTAIVNGECEVTKDHCIKSNAGLYYNNYQEFEEIIEKLEKEPELRKMLGQNGIKYVHENYCWPVITNQITNFLNSLM